MVVGEDLDFDMARMFEEHLDIDIGIAEGAPRLLARQRNRIRQLLLATNDAHTAAAAAARGFHDDRIAGFGCDMAHAPVFLWQGATRARHARHTRGAHGFLGGDLVAHRADNIGRRTDEDEAGLLDSFGEARIFREEAIAGMDSPCPGRLGRQEDRGDVEIAVARGCGADAEALVGQLHMAQIAVSLGMNGDRLETQRPAGTQDAQRDFPTVGDKNRIEHGQSPISNSSMPRTTGAPSSTMMDWMRPARSASIGVSIFIASMRPRTCPSSIVSPGFT